MRPSGSAVHCNIERDITDNADALFAGVGVELFPMSLKLILLEEIKAHLVGKLYFCLRKRLFFPHLKAVLPGLPALAVFSLLNRHKEGIVAQPVSFFLKKRLIFGLLARRTYMETAVHGLSESLIRFAKEGITVLIHGAVIHLFIVGSKPYRLTFLPGKQSVADQLLQVNKIRVSGKGRDRLVRTVAKPGLAERKHLPCALPGFL